jgi:hypothetical protein
MIGKFYLKFVFWKPAEALPASEENLEPGADPFELEA